MNPGVSSHTSHYKTALPVGKWYGTKKKKNIFRFDSTISNLLTFKKPIELSTKNIFLFGKLYGRYNLKNFISLEVEKTDTGFLVYESGSGAYGAGTTLHEAIDDFKSMLAEMFEELSEDNIRLSRPLRKKLAYLKSIIS